MSPCWMRKFPGKPSCIAMQLQAYMARLQSNNAFHSLLGIQEMLRSGVAPGMSQGDAKHALHDKAAVTDEDTLRRLLRYSGYSEAAYGTDQKDVPVFVPSGVSAKDVVAGVWKSQMLKPAWFVAIDDKEQAVVLAIRGTHNISDALTDAAAASLDFKLERSKDADGPTAVHGGMLRAALWLLAETHDPLRDALQSERCKGYSLHITGHSLGGGCASLVSALLNDGVQLPGQKDQPKLKDLASRIHAYTFCPAAVASAAIAQAYSDVVTAVAMESDIVPRFCCTSASALLEEACSFAPDAKKRLKERFDKTYTAAALKHLDKAADRARLHADSIAARLSKNEHVRGAAASMHSVAVTAHSAATAGAAYATSAGRTLLTGAVTRVSALQDRFSKRSNSATSSDSKTDEGGKTADASDAKEKEESEEGGVEGGHAKDEGAREAKAYIREIGLETSYLTEPVKLFPMGSLYMVRGVFPAESEQGVATEHEATPTDAASDGKSDMGQDTGMASTTLRSHDFEAYVIVPAEHVQYEKVLLNARMIKDHLLGDVRGYLRIALLFAREHGQA